MSTPKMERLNVSQWPGRFHSKDYPHKPEGSHNEQAIVWKFEKALQMQNQDSAIYLHERQYMLIW